MHMPAQPTLLVKAQGVQAKISPLPALCKLPAEAYPDVKDGKLRTPRPGVRPLMDMSLADDA